MSLRWTELMFFLLPRTNHWQKQPWVYCKRFNSAMPRCPSKGSPIWQKKPKKIWFFCRTRVEVAHVGQVAQVAHVGVATDVLDRPPAVIRHRVLQYTESPAAPKQPKQRKHWTVQWVGLNQKQTCWHWNFVQKLNCDSYGKIANWTRGKKSEQPAMHTWDSIHDCRKSLKDLGGFGWFCWNHEGIMNLRQPPLLIDVDDWGVAQLAPKTLRENGARCLHVPHWDKDRKTCSKRQLSCSLNALSAKELLQNLVVPRIMGGRGQVWAHSPRG